METNHEMTLTKLMNKFLSKQISKKAFTQIDLIVTIIVVLALVGWFGMSYTGERARMAKCAHNLKFLGQLTQDYANEHAGSLPPARVQQPQIAWDMQIAPYLRPNQVKSGIDPFFLCPSDHLERGRPRSYAMTAHDMTAANWPPGPDNETGVGLSWDNENIKQLLGDKAAESVAKGNSDALALVKLSWLPSPADTVVLTELIDRDNLVKNIQKATVSSPTEQQAPFDDTTASFHYGRFNYLMADGHVEALSALQTGTLDGSDGIWTISKGGRQ
jgi:prepilin-type processing-associated H-X9-DG protein